MELTIFYGRGMSSNSYFLDGTKKVLIDAGMDDSILSKLPKLDFLILTHAHFDHVSMAPGLVRRFNCEVWMGKDEADFLESDAEEASVSDLFGVGPDIGFRISRRLLDGEILDFGDFKLNVIVTPGHTVGGICLYEPITKTLFSGDTLFAEGFGRYDLPGGDLDELEKSLRRLAELDVGVICPGHGPVRKIKSKDELRRLISSL